MRWATRHPPRRAIPPPRARWAPAREPPPPPPRARGGSRPLPRGRHRARRAALLAPGAPRDALPRPRPVRGGRGGAVRGRPQVQPRSAPERRLRAPSRLPSRVDLRRHPLLLPRLRHAPRPVPGAPLPPTETPPPGVRTNAPRSLRSRPHRRGLAVRPRRVLRRRHPLRRPGFLATNGYPNGFWGWGGEDNAQFLRCARARLWLERVHRCAFDDLEGLDTVEEKLAALDVAGARCAAKDKRRLLRRNAAGDAWTRDGLADVRFEIEGDEIQLGGESNSDTNDGSSPSPRGVRFVARLLAGRWDELRCVECGERKGPDGYAASQYRTAMFWAKKTKHEAGHEEERIPTRCHWDERGAASGEATIEAEGEGRGNRDRVVARSKTGREVFGGGKGSEDRGVAKERQGEQEGRLAGDVRGVWGGSRVAERTLRAPTVHRVRAGERGVTTKSRRHLGTARFQSNLCF